MIADERVGCRSVIRVTLIIAGMSSEKEMYCHVTRACMENY